MKNNSGNTSETSVRIYSVSSEVRAFAFVFFTIISCLLTIDSFSQDTNRIDTSGRKQGYWIITGSMKATPGFKADQKIEEGNYLDNKKHGVWITYFPNGKMKFKAEYKNNRPNGSYTIYYESGCIEEEGTWKNSHNVGGFKRYFDKKDTCGIVAIEKSFDSNGKVQTWKEYCTQDKALIIYDALSNTWLIAGTDKICTHKKTAYKEINPPIDYHKKRDTVIFFQDTITGKCKKYDGYNHLLEDGICRDGVLWDGIKYIYDKNGLLMKTEKYKEGKFIAEPEPKIKDGYNKIYDDQKRIKWDGVFKNGKLWNGKWYKYDKNGLLFKIEIYKEGKYVGDAEID